MWPLPAATKSLEKHVGEDTQQGLLYIHEVISGAVFLCIFFPYIQCSFCLSLFQTLFSFPQWPALHFISFIRHTLKLPITILFPFFEHVFHIHIKHFAFKNKSILCLKSHAFVIFPMKYLVLDSKTASSIKYLLQVSLFLGKIRQSIRDTFFLFNYEIIFQKTSYISYYWFF